MSKVNTKMPESIKICFIDKPILKTLSEEEIGHLVLDSLEYAENGIIPDIASKSVNYQFAFEIMKKNIDNTAKWCMERIAKEQEKEERKLARKERARAREEERI